MEEVSLKMIQLRYDQIKSILQLDQVLNCIVMHQKKDMDSIEHVLHGSINRPVRSTEKVAVSSAPEEAKNHRMMVNVQIIHRKTEPSTSVINCQLITNLSG